MNVDLNLGTAASVVFPADPNARVMSTPDASYASCGWRVAMPADGETFFAGAFVDDVGVVPNASGIDTLEGPATAVFRRSRSDGPTRRTAGPASWSAGSA